MGFTHVPAPEKKTAIARHDMGREQPTNSGADAVGADNEIGRNLFTAGQQHHRTVVGLPDVEKLNAKMIALRWKRRIKQIEEAAPRGQILRIVEACELVAVAVERNATADVDARRAIARQADGLQDGGQFRMTGNPGAP